jgi:hypothetical protein
MRNRYRDAIVAGATAGVLGVVWLGVTHVAGQVQRGNQPQIPYRAP